MNYNELLKRIENYKLKFNVLENKDDSKTNNFVLNDVDLEIIKTYLLEQKKKK